MNESISPPTDGAPSAPTRPFAAPFAPLGLGSHHERRLDWLAEFSTVLAQVDDESFAACLTNCLLPDVVDMYSIDIVQANGAIETLVTAHVDTQLNVLLNNTLLRDPHDPNISVGVPQVIRTGRPEFYPVMDQAQRSALAGNANQAELLATPQVCTGAILPLIIQGRAIGALSIGIMHAEHQLDATNSSFVTEIAQRLALVLDNQRLRQQARAANEARDATLAIVAHELRTPLAAVIAQVQILRRRADDAELQGKLLVQGLAALDSQTKRLNLLVDMLLDATQFSHQPRPLAHERFELGQLLRRMHENVAATATLTQHTLYLNMSDEALLIDGDPLRIEQALQNLLQNAVKYSPYGGAITLRLERNNTNARITLTDQGIGIPLDARTRIFERFYRAANATSQGISGVGVGLYIVHAIIALHHGTIFVADTPDNGATFVIDLPLNEN